MTTEKNQLVKLLWDSQFFGYGVGKVELEAISVVQILNIIKEAKEDCLKVIYLIAKDFDTLSIQRTEAVGAILYDKKTTYFKKSQPAPLLSSCINSYSKNLSAEPLYSLAIQSGAYSRFFTDKNFQYAEFQRLYTTWIENSVNRSIAREVLVYKEKEEDYKGLITLGIKDSRLDIGLLAVDTKYRGKNIGSKLLNAATDYADRWECSGMQVVAQGTNVLACKFYEKHGFQKESVQYLLHLWI